MSSIQEYLEELHIGQTSNHSSQHGEEFNILTINGNDDD